MRLLIDVGKVRPKGAVQNQTGIETRSMLLQVVAVQSSPTTDGARLIIQMQIGNKVISAGDIGYFSLHRMPSIHTFYRFIVGGAKRKIECAKGFFEKVLSFWSSQ